MPREDEIKTHNVFIDTQAYFEHRFDWSGKILGKLAEFAREGDLSLISTEVTIREVKAQLEEVVNELRDRLKRSESILAQLKLTHSIDDPSAATAVLNGNFEKFLKLSRTKVIPITTDVTSVLEDYFTKRPPFGHGKKKAEFPDAFVIAALKRWCDKSKQSIYVVSRDPDLAASCSSEGPLLHLESIQQLLSLAVVRAEIRSKLVAAVQESNSLKQKVRSYFEKLELVDLANDIRLDDISVEEPTIHNVNIVDRDQNTFLLEAELEVVISGQVRRISDDVDDTFSGPSHRPHPKLEYFEDAHFTYPEVEVSFDPNDPASLSIDSVYFGSEEFKVSVSESTYSFLGRGSKSVTLRLPRRLW